MKNNKEVSLTPFKAIIRIIKSKQPDMYNDKKIYGSHEVLREKLIYAKDKKEVKKILIDKYPEFFLNNKIYEKESKKDEDQIVYVLIYPLYDYEIADLNSGKWVCSGCGQEHENKYISRPKISNDLGPNYLFCSVYDMPDRAEKEYSDRHCIQLFRDSFINQDGIEPPDRLEFVTKDSPIYIYKVTEKETGKCYIGKTKNAPFFRWWEHLKHSYSPFGVYLRNTSLSQWTFEVLEELPSLTTDKEVFKIESDYILEYNSIDNGFNTLISSKNIEKLDDKD